ncbi:MAG: hypothetical protein PWR03_208 [Tenuifilum sp.]|jgi:hypothetical protein|uniref:DUF4190 domain-containing protein n=1 Tax=Tenuifilum thalassicum TaxID=2590900 RepID=A0A7D4B9Y7_9BACT|nr:MULTISPECIES: hypothetical protein [Tenuifilum]MDI3526025.1 hypothetical protein [Tenuifilum sp.]QKG79040.1 hypothetical protein FHG85_01755 [Tenuifilum thalassicum]
MNVEVKTTAGQAMGIVGIVLAVISIILAFIPCIGFVALLPAALAVVFSIISIVQASNGYGSKGLGIGALIISVLSILLAVLWLTIIGGGVSILNELERNPDKIDQITRELEKELKDSNIEIRIETDSMVKTLRTLENATDSVQVVTIKKTKTQKEGEFKKARITIDTDSVQVKIEATEKQ